MTYASHSPAPRPALTLRTRTRGPDSAPARRARALPWWWGLVGATALGLALRVGYVLIWKRHARFSGDATYYHLAANLLAQGHGFVEPFYWVRHIAVPGADHPPLYIVALAVPSALGWSGWLAHQVTSCLIGAATVAAIGLAARELAGPRAGLVAALVAAVHPVLWVNDGVVMSESLVQLTVALALLGAYRWWKRPGWRPAVATGAACALAALTRAELVLLAPLLLVPLALRLRGVARPRRLGLLGASVAAMAATIAPWAGYNATRFHRPVPLSTGLGPVLAAANCDATFNGPFLGYWSYPCQAQVPRAPGDLSDQDLAYRSHALAYASRHRGHLPVVVGARLGRAWGLYRPVQLLRIERAVEDRELPPAEAGLGLFFVLAALSAVGAVGLRRRAGPTALPIVALVATVSLTSAVTYGTTRFRAPADVGLVVLGSAGVALLLEERARRRGRRRTEPSLREPLAALPETAAAGPAGASRA